MSNVARPRKSDGVISLCWDCQNYSCQWIKEGKPIPGWTAEKNIIHNREKDTESFSVKRCPEFLSAVDYEDVRCPGCGKLLFRREKGSGGIVSIKCRRCKKINLIYPGK